MTKTDIEQIKADREAGSKGRFIYVESGSCSHIRSEFCGSNGVEYIRNENGSIVDQPLYVEWLYDENSHREGADLRRFIRSPHTEDALIKAVELLEKAQKLNADFSHDVGITDFLERFK